MLYIEDRAVWQGTPLITKAEEIASVCWVCPDCNGDAPRDDLTYHKEPLKVCCFCGEVKRECFALWLWRSGHEEWLGHHLLPDHTKTHYTEANAADLNATSRFWDALRGHRHPELDAAQKVLRILRGD